MRREGFEELYREHFPRVLGTAFLLTGSREDAMDLAQETFARAYERWRSVSGHEYPAAWLQRVVTNLAMSWHRRRLVRARHRREELTVPAPEVPEPAVLDALRRLTAGQRAVIVLRFYADLPYGEVARALGKKPGTVRAQASQAMARLRPILQARGVHQ